MKKSLILTVIVLLAGLGITGFILMDNEGGSSLADARENYKKYCASCHGAQLQSFVNRKWLYGNSWNEVAASIKNGIPEDGMPAYDTTFTDAEIKALTSYILGGIESLTQDDFNEKPNWSGKIESEDQKFKLEKVVTGLRSPWGMAFLPNGDMLVTDKFGTLYRHTKKDGLVEIEGAPGVNSRGQGGLMDVAVHPNYGENGWIYLTYSKPKDRLNTTAILRAKLQDDKLVDKEDIFVAEPYFSTRHHYGSKMVFDKEGYLYFSVGDRGRRDQNPQSIKNHCGKIHRINDDGSIPEDNPFVAEKGAKASIYSYGHRNPQGVAMHPETGEIWDTEHGPRGGDEVNLIQPGVNYGWPVISYGINYNGTIFTDLTEQDGLEQPLKYWVPSIAPCGTLFVSGDRYPKWKNDLLVGSLRFEYIARLKMDGNNIISEEPLLKGIGRVRDIKVDNDGFLYFSVENPGIVYKIVPVK